MWTFLVVVAALVAYDLLKAATKFSLHVWYEMTKSQDNEPAAAPPAADKSPRPVTAVVVNAARRYVSIG